MSQELAIRTRGLSRRFGDLVVVKDLNLEVPKNCVFGFLGPNGAGKTTTIRMLLGLVHPDCGEIQLLGEQPTSKNRSKLMSRVGALVESPSLYGHLTGRENLEVTSRLLGLGRTDIDRVLGMTRLDHAATRKAGHYSTGMRQRLGLAQALLQRPDLLILDEPTNGLDPAGILEFRELISSMPDQYGVSVFLSSHLLHEVEQMASHVGILRRGDLVFQGRLEQLRSQTGQSLTVKVDQPERACDLLRENHGDVRLDQGLLVLNVDGQETAAVINSTLVNSGLKVFHLTLNNQSLERLFFDSTSRGEGDPE